MFEVIMRSFSIFLFYFLSLYMSSFLSDFHPLAAISKVTLGNSPLIAIGSSGSPLCLYLLAE